jgi:hypothetical protein
VTGMATLTNGQGKSPRSACQNESKQHVAGEHGTAFSRCVSGAAKLLKDQSQSNSSDTPSDTTPTTTT